MLYTGLDETLRQVFFHVSSVVTTTGYSLCNYGSYAAYSSFAKIILSALMLLGRLEIFPLLLVFTPIFRKAK